SSATSRRTAASSDSPTVTRPPGRLHRPTPGGRPRCTRRTRPSSTTTAPTPTSGTVGYSRTRSNSRPSADGTSLSTGALWHPALHRPGLGAVLLHDEGLHQRLLVRRQAGGREQCPHALPQRGGARTE